MRAFVSLPIPDTTRTEVAAIVERLRKGLVFGGPGVKWVDPALLHFTLKFLGDGVPEDAAFLETVRERLGEALRDAPPPRVEWSGLSALPTIRRPRVIHLGLERGSREAVGALASRVERVFLALGFPAEPGPFQPHLTLGRIKAERGARVVAGVLSSHRSYAPAPVTLDTVEVMRSVLGSEGPTYTSLLSFRLTAPPPAPPAAPPAVPPPTSPAAADEPAS